jgi:hypothetical protein
MRFQPGQSGNPAGRPKGRVSGRMQLIKSLDRLLQDETNQNALLNGLQQRMHDDPVWFFRRIIMPLLPKEASVSIEHSGVIEWRLLSDTPPIGLKNKSTIPVTGDSVLSVPGGDSEKPSALPENCWSAPSSTPANTDG